MKTRIMLGCVLVFCLVAAAGLAAESKETWKYSATVVDTNGNPIADAVAKCYQHEIRQNAFPIPSNMALKETVKTGTNGAFSFKLTRNSTTIVVSKPGMSFSWRQVSPSMEMTGKVERIVLGPPETVTGVVTDENAKSLANAEVWLATCFMELPREEGGRTYTYLQGTPAQDTVATLTDAEGRFTLSGFPANSRLDLAARAPDKAMREFKRNYLGPNTIQFRAGQNDIKLVVEPAANLEGRILAEDASQKLPTTLLSLQRDGAMMLRPVDPVVALEADGSFRFTNILAGKYMIRAQIGTNFPAKWVAPNKQVEVKVGETLRDVSIIATRGGLLEVSVIQQDNKKPMAGVSVNANAESFYAGGITDSNGFIVLRLPAGEYRVTANQSGSRSEAASTRVELGLTNRVNIELKAPPIIAGVVRNVEGKPMAGVEVSIFPSSYGNIAKTTDNDGRFEIQWSPREYERDRSFFIYARQQDNNLIATQDIDEDTRKVDLRLELGLEVVGRVEDPNGKGIPNASVSMTVWSGNMGMSFGKTPQTDNEGRYQVRSLPLDRRITANANAKGFGSTSQEVEQGQTNRVELPPFVLKVADRILAGQLLDDEEKPVADAYVHLYGSGQPNGNVRTDEKGRFKFDQVCEGPLRLSASKENAYGSMSAEGGDTNVVLQLGVSRSSESAQPKRASLKGRALPDLAGLGLSGNVVPKEKRLLVCLFDAEQRPSRRALRTLAEQHEALQKKGLVVLAIQAAIVDAEVVKGLQEPSPLPFPVGRVTEKKPDFKWVTDVETLPWLILVNEKGQVLDEGFDLESIEAESPTQSTEKASETKIPGPTNLRMSLQ